MASLTESLSASTVQRTLFFVLSGEHPSLPAAEVEAVLDSAGIQFNRTRTSYRLLLMEAPEEALAAASNRSLMYDLCGIALGECNADKNVIHRFVRSLPLEDLAKGAESFAVRSTRLGGVSRFLGRVDLEKYVGAIIQQQVPRLKVRLGSPDLTFACVLFADSLLIGLSRFTKPSGLVAPRRPRKRPVFHPATMPPKIARCMVNLARARPGATFTDPFSGVGGIAIEAAVIGCRVIALDASVRMIRGARKNLKHFELGALGIINGDARHMPVHDVDAIATDPPYGRDSSTMGIQVADLVSDFLGGARSSLKKGAHICISAPVEVQLEDFARDSGFIVRERHLVRVHRSLTRQFVVLKNA